MNTIPRDGNYVKPDGSYVLDWSDSKGTIWMGVLEVSRYIAMHMIAESACESNREHRSSVDGIVLAEKPIPEEWMLPSNKDLYVLYVDWGIAARKVTGIYNYDG